MLCDGASTTPLSTRGPVLYSPLTAIPDEPLLQAASGAGLSGRPLRLVVARRPPSLAAAARARRRSAVRDPPLSAAPDGVSPLRGRDQPGCARARGRGQGARGAATPAGPVDLG